MKFDLLVEKILTEAVESNYLYHATSFDGLKNILKTGFIKAAKGPQTATIYQTKFDTISTTRDIRYAIGKRDIEISNSAYDDIVLVLDKGKISQKYKIIKTSQHTPSQIDTKPKDENRNLDFLNKQFKRKHNLQKELKGSNKEYNHLNYFASKSGKEYEEAIVVRKGNLPIKDILIGFYVNHKTEDPEIINNPLRLDMPRLNQFVKHKII